MMEGVPVTSARELRMLVVKNTTDPALHSSIEEGVPGSSNDSWIPGVPLPDSLGMWWERIHSAKLFVDLEYNQWGLVVWPRDLVHRKNAEFRNAGRDDLTPDDIIIGEFLGDSDLLMVNCDQSTPHFGSIWVVPPIDPREDWDRVGSDMNEFISNFVKSGGQKYWEG
jgi:hypothetical protein